LFRYLTTSSPFSLLMVGTLSMVIFWTI
jgi:hypothetical protein